MLVSLMPLAMAMRFGRLVGLLLYHLLSGRRRIAEENISSCLDYMRSQPGWGGGDATAAELTRAVFINMGRSLAETCRLYRGTGRALIDSIEVHEKEYFENARAQNNGLIFLTGHCGNWELLALGYGRIFNSPISCLARRQDSPYLNHMAEEMRKWYNNRLIYKSGALKGIISAVRKKETIGILVDQSVMPEEGCVINFLGRKAWASKLPVVVAHKTGVPVVPAFIRREGDHHVMFFQPAINFEGDRSDAGVIRDVQLYSSYIERFIIENPTEWYWVHRRWKRTEGLQS